LLVLLPTSLMRVLVLRVCVLLLLLLLPYNSPSGVAVMLLAYV
jgi:hypothetical protein